MALKVCGATQSICTRRVLTALIEKNVPYQLEKVDFIMAREHKSEAFLKLQPFGKIPVLEDDVSLSTKAGPWPNTSRRSSRVKARSSSQWTMT